MEDWLLLMLVGIICSIGLVTIAAPYDEQVICARARPLAYQQQGGATVVAQVCDVWELSPRRP